MSQIAVFYVEFICDILQASELLEIWGANAGPLTWRLTPPEARKVLSLRYNVVKLVCLDDNFFYLF